MIHVCIGKNRFRTLLDSGAQFSLVSDEFLNLCDETLIKETTTRQVPLVSASGHRLKVTKTVKIRITLEKVRMYHSFYVVENLGHDMILGVDFLNERKAVLDFENDLLKIGKVFFPLARKTNTTLDEVNLVRLSEDVHIYPRTSAQLKCHTSKRKGAGNEFVLTQMTTSPCFEDEPGILLPNAVVRTSKNKHVPWAIVNETGKHFFFRKGQVLGKATKVEIRETECNINTVDASVSPEAVSDADKLKLFDLSHVPVEQKENLISVLKANIDVFVTKDSELTQTHVTEMVINTQGHLPIRQRPYRVPLTQRPVLEKHIDQMLEAGIIRRSNSPWLSPVIVVPKKDGSQRICIDFRKLNAITVIPAPSIPNAEDILYSLGNSKFRTSLDLKSGFWQVPIREQDKEETAFGTDAGLFEWNSMPFGLSSSPSVFQNLINAVLGDVRKFALAFIDDIIVFSDTFEEHLEHLNIVFEKLRQANLRLKISKCEFLKKKLQYLGHVISDQGISVDPHKVDVITKMQPPRTIREVRGFIGMSSYYRKYVPNFSEIARPLIALTRKNVRFEWNDAAQTAFETLKEKLT